ncbi:MAG: cupin domain-containing protein [Candidatus Omnitrophota bacterium]
MKIKIEHPDQNQLKQRGVFTWPIWQKEPSVFNWFYEANEQCYLLEGKVTVKTVEGEVSFGQGDFVVFPKGLQCVWTIHERVRKHYAFF